MTTRANTKTRKRRKDAGQPKELTEEHKLKMREARERKKQERETAEQVNLKDTVERLKERVAKMEREDTKTLATYQRTSSDKNFNLWMRANSNLLNAVTALKAHEQRLAREG